MQVAEAARRLFVLAGLTSGLGGCQRGRAPAAGEASVAPVRHVDDGAAASDAPAQDGGTVVEARAPLPDVTSAWCEAGWRAIDEGTCFFAPPGATRLMIYLAGIMPPTAKSAQKENVQHVVLAAARRAGVAALLPRGRRGIGPADARDWWAWPTTAADYTKHATALVAEWRAVRQQLEASLGPFEHVYLAGSSSGAYFLTSLALRGDVEMDGYAAASGGAPTSVKPGIAKRPFYVGFATGDPTNGSAKALGATLKSAGWPVRVAEHPGGHGAREVYLDEALAFWTSP